MMRHEDPDARGRNAQSEGLFVQALRLANLVQSLLLESSLYPMQDIKYVMILGSTKIRSRSIDAAR